MTAETLVVACTDPTNVVALDDVRMSVGVRRVQPVVATPSALTAALARHRGIGGIRGGDAQADGLLDAVEEPEEADELEEVHVDDGPMARLADGIVASALRDNASDIHVEPGPRETVVRYRIDGVLTQVVAVPRSKSGALLSRIKLMAGLDIAEKRRPQDGRAGVPPRGRLRRPARQRAAVAAR